MIASATILLLFLSGLSAPPAAAELSPDAAPGVAAYEAGEYERAYELLKPVADAGDVQARYLMARLSSVLIPERVDYTAALAYLDKPTRCQSAAALGLYASLVGEVGGTEAARVREAELYKEAAEAGDLTSLRNLGHVLFKHLQRPFIGGSYLLEASRLDDIESSRFIEAVGGKPNGAEAIARLESIVEEQPLTRRWPLLDEDARECEFARDR